MPFVGNTGPLDTLSGKSSRLHRHRFSLVLYSSGLDSILSLGDSSARVFQAQAPAPHPNLWPTSDEHEFLSAHFRNAMSEHWTACVTVCCALLRALAMALKLPEDALVALHSLGDHVMELKYYPAPTSVPLHLATGTEAN